MRLVLVIDDVLQIDAGDGVQFFEKLLIENERHAGDFFDARLRLRFLVDEIGRDGDSQSTSKLLPFETWNQ